jgi:hypothetical protein
MLSGRIFAEGERERMFLRVLGGILFRRQGFLSGTWDESDFEMVMGGMVVV